MRGRRAAFLALGALVMGCAREPERDRVALRLVEHVPPADRDFDDGDCALDNEHRPSLGCTPWRVRAGGEVTEADQFPTVRLQVPPGERGRTTFLKLFRSGPRGARRAERLVHPRSIAPRGAIVDVPIPNVPPRAVAVGETVTMWSRLPPRPRYETTPVAIPPQARLTVGIGLDPDSPPAGVDAVEFTLTAVTDAGRHELLRARVRPEDPAGARWQEHVVALDSLAGQAVRFVFDATTQLQPGVAANRAVVVPLWGAPEVLVPIVGDDRPSVVLVSLDTMRADFLGTRIGDQPLTPRLDALAREGVVFERVSTTFPSTTGAHLSMLTGLYPIRLGVNDPSRQVHASSRLLAEAIGAAGWRTAAVTEDVMLAIQVGFSRGTSHYRENLEGEPVDPPSYKVEHTIDAAIAWIEGHCRERFFLFVHTYAVHYPYAAPERYQFTTWQDGGVARPLAEAPGPTRLRLRYAADVRQADEQVGRLVDALVRLGRGDDTIVLVTGDHGEAFREHENIWGHGMTIFGEVLQVPLVVWGPGRIPAGRRIATPVSLADLPPTILALAGAPPLDDIDGESQAARIAGAPDDLERVVFAEGPPIPGLHPRQVTARTATMKWLRTESDPPALVAYDLAADPGEHAPLDTPALRARGEELLGRYDALGERAAPASDVPIPDEMRERLEALGYAD